MTAEPSLKGGWLAGARVFQADRVAHAKVGTEKRLGGLREEARTRTGRAFGGQGKGMGRIIREELRDAGRSWSEDTIVRSLDFILME